MFKKLVVGALAAGIALTGGGSGQLQQVQKMDLIHQVL